MEVHHHTHTERKKWTHYFWEFFMLFLAVTLGFFVENQREHLVEHQREKVFMVSMLRDLESDTGTFRSMISIYSQVMVHVDSLTTLLSDFENLDKNAAIIYHHQVYLHDYRKLTYSDRTIQQLKNGGNFRLIRNDSVSNAIIAYDRMVLNGIESMQEQLLLRRHLKLNEGSSSIFKFGLLLERHKREDESISIALLKPPYFILPTKERVDYVVNDLQLYSMALMWFIRNVKETSQQAIELSGLIKKEYHLK